MCSSAGIFACRQDVRAGFRMLWRHYPSETSCPALLCCRQPPWPGRFVQGIVPVPADQSQSAPHCIQQHAKCQLRDEHDVASRCQPGSRIAKFVFGQSGRARAAGEWSGGSRGGVDWRSCFNLLLRWQREAVLWGQIFWRRQTPRMNANIFHSRAFAVAHRSVRVFEINRR